MKLKLDLSWPRQRAYSSYYVATTQTNYLVCDLASAVLIRILLRNLYLPVLFLRSRGIFVTCFFFFFLRTSCVTCPERKWETGIRLNLQGILLYITGVTRLTIKIVHNNHIVGRLTVVTYDVLEQVHRSSFRKGPQVMLAFIWLPAASRST